MKKNIEIKRVASPYPYVIAGAVYIIGTFILPMYKLYSYIILIILSLLCYLIIKKLNLFEDQQIEIEIPVTYDNEEVKEILLLGQSKIKLLKDNVELIDNQSLYKDVSEIIKTSEAILQLVEENQQLAKKVKKYFHYYLSEVINMVKTYDDFEEDSLNVDNVKKSKENIEKTIQNANVSFLKFYNDLYEGKAMDVDVDLKVFEGMLNRLD